MFIRQLLCKGEAKLAVAKAVALLSALTLLLTLFARTGEAQVSLLAKDQTGAQASADIGFANLTPPQSGSNVFHVDPDGADNIVGTVDDGSDSTGPDGTAQPGTRDRPWKTITKAARTLTRGQVAYVHGGTYNERITTTNPGEPSAPIWLVEAPGESAVIKGTGASGGPFVRITQPYWIVDGFEINAGGSFAQAVRFDGVKHAVVRNIDAHHGVGNAAIVFYKAEDAALLNSKVHEYSWTEADGSPKDSHGVAIYRDSKRILVKGNDSWGHTGDDVQCVDEDVVASADDPTDITIEGNRYGNTHRGGTLRTRTRENAVDIKTCRNVTVRANKMFGFRPASTAPGGAALVAHVNADRVLVEHNRFWDNGIAASLGSKQNCCLGSVVFRRNLVFESTTLSGGKGGGVRVGPARRFEAYHNTFYDGTWEDQDLVFPNKKGGVMRIDNLRYRHFKPLLEAAGLPSVRLYDLRHSFSTLWVESGEDLELLQRILGHTSIKTTADVYVHLGEASKKRAMERFGRNYRVPKGPSEGSENAV